jgi:hypothetical protein
MTMASEKLALVIFVFINRCINRHARLTLNSSCLWMFTVLEFSSSFQCTENV